MDFVTPHLLIGNLAEACDEELLRRFKIEAVVNCCQEAPPQELYQKLGVKAVWIPFEDGMSFGPERHAVFARTLEFIKKELETGKNVLVHCRAGVSRSSAFMASYLFWSGAEPTFDEAFRRVRTAHPIALPHFNTIASFKEFLGLAPEREAYIEFWLKEMVKRGYL